MAKTVACSPTNRPVPASPRPRVLPPPTNFFSRPYLHFAVSLLTDFVISNAVVARQGFGHGYTDD
ncbi:MAG: hypothetical protein SWX82_31730 [Cyanobacteriota bacterium]|nr:hypothetical protein [Cyanobacteriota bacterium]